MNQKLHPYHVKVWEAPTTYVGPLGGAQPWLLLRISWGVYTSTRHSPQGPWDPDSIALCYHLVGRFYWSYVCNPRSQISETHGVPVDSQSLCMVGTAGWVHCWLQRQEELGGWALASSLCGSGCCCTTSKPDKSFVTGASFSLCVKQG